MNECMNAWTSMIKKNILKSKKADRKQSTNGFIPINAKWFVWDESQPKNCLTHSSINQKASIFLFIDVIGSFQNNYIFPHYILQSVALREELLPKNRTMKTTKYKNENRKNKSNKKKSKVKNKIFRNFIYRNYSKKFHEQNFDGSLWCVFTVFF